MSIARTSGRLPLAVGAAALAAAAVTGCSSDPGTTPDMPAVTAHESAASPGAAPTAVPTFNTSGSPAFGSPSSTPTGPPIPTGAALRALLPTAATLPAGWTIKGNGNQNDTGTYVVDDPVAPMLSKEPCTQMRLAGTILSQDFKASGTMEEVYDGENMVQVYLAAYHPGDAAKLLGEIRAYTERCKSFTGKGMDGKPVPLTVTQQPVSGLGDEALDMRKVPQGPYHSEEIVVTRVGDRLLFLSGDDILGRLPNLMQLAVPLSKSVK
ncbi:hypothetical protein GCM10018790_78090 [Kitasatospora xanthocidica]|uniref:hypothetical protein n=1 Tax=Kitasatospora xanthocidica TaxID=83382 RepID=UPI00167C078B|nr:hypothetical protein [Kitasatospora xanthocidica]GHF89089.1 hypothetical protein GCM10018790_78090 [Kitasatospora xanthocidica]